VKPGDLIEWVYELSGNTVHPHETVWSPEDERPVHVGSNLTHLLISCEGDTFKWLNEKGSFRCTFSRSSDHSANLGRIVPREKK
jgi:hypothetical protein